jgi:hypothetical protein
MVDNHLLISSLPMMSSDLPRIALELSFLLDNSVLVDIDHSLSRS